MKRLAGSIVVALGVTWPVASQACGACAEDKIAATYDHAVVQRAAARGDVMVFCELSAAPGTPMDAARVRDAARATPGVQPRSVRVSAQPAALSFAVAPGLQVQAVAALQRSLGPGTRLTLLRSASQR